MRFISMIFLLFFTAFSADLAAQSGRVGPKQSSEAAAAPPNSVAAETRDLSAEQMYTEASLYAMNKYAEYQQKKVPYNRVLHEKTQRDQKQLAVKYATVIALRKDLSADDVYYLGMLHSIAGNDENADETMRRYLTLEKTSAEKAQTARSVLVEIAAKRKNFEEAERLLLEYLKTEPVKISERARMETELAKNYKESGQLDKAARHAEEAFRASKTLFQDQSSRARGLNDLLVTGMRVFDIYKQNAKTDQADAALKDLRKTAVFVESTEIFYASVDALIKFMIETGRKPTALELFQESLKLAETGFKSKAAQDDITRRLKRREKHYRLLGDPAPELADVDRWFPGSARSLAGMRGKVVLLDFWATWCLPCLEVFPHLIGWHQQFQKDGLEILGVTRYYGEVRGMKADNENELEYLRNFRTAQNLPYDFVVSKNRTNQIVYGATSIPTTVLIDRKGVVRYIETGTSSFEELQEVIEKLLAEK